MENKFYRKDGENILLNLVKKNEFTNKKFIFLIILIPILLFLFFNNKGIIQRIGLEMERKKLLEQISLEEQRQKKFQEDIYLIKNSNEKIEKIAREKYNMKRPGETVYKLKK